MIVAGGWTRRRGCDAGPNGVARPARVAHGQRSPRSARRPIADDVIELPRVGAASLDLFKQTPKQAHVVQRRASAVQVDAPDVGETTWDVNGVHLATAGTLDLTTCHSSTPFPPVAE
jgi:hypothetical protein